MSSSPTTPTSPGSPSSTTGADADKLRKRLLAYRIMANVCGCTLLIFCVALTLKYGFDDDVIAWVSFPHGWLYLIYLITVLLLGTEMRWPPGRMIQIMLAGTIPFLSFYAERKVTAQVRSAAR